MPKQELDINELIDTVDDLRNALRDINMYIKSGEGPGFIAELVQDYCDRFDIATGQLTYEQQMVKEFGREPGKGMKLVRSLRSNTVVEIEEDCPRCCDPSTELYWSM